MKRNHIPDSQVETEIRRLTESPYVKLARKEQQIIYRRRKYLNQLQALEKRGMELEDQGYTLENIYDEYDESEDIL